MRRPPFLVPIAVLLLVVAGALPASAKDGQWSVSSALKQVDKAYKKLRWATANVDWDETFDGRMVQGEGKVWIDLTGKMRAEVAGSNPRTIVVVGARAYIYRPLKTEATEYNLTFDKDLMVQYALVGFIPGGSSLKKDYKVRLVREEVLENGRKALQFALSPKDKAVAAAITVIQLWIDTETWLPAQQLIRLNYGGLQATVRYHEIFVEEQLPYSLFSPKWPVGTKLVKEQ